ncbi:MAG: hypothetical protein DDT33_00774 [Firmicutes bacterium]|nr:hypothetical protein [Bacillota bacterium]
MSIGIQLLTVILHEQLFPQCKQRWHQLIRLAGSAFVRHFTTHATATGSCFPAVKLAGQLLALQLLPGQQRGTPGTGYTEKRGNFDLPPGNILHGSQYRPVKSDASLETDSAADFLKTHNSVQIVLGHGITQSGHDIRQRRTQRQVMTDIGFHIDGAALAQRHRLFRA